VPQETHPKVSTQPTQSEKEEYTTMILDETDLADIDLEQLEEALN
jgi:hypothetical protein